MQAPQESGYALLRDPHRNQGSAFSDASRRKYGLEGLLPPGPDTLDMQVRRINDELSHLDEDLHRYLLLSDLQARNETLYYAVLMSDPARFIPLVYTPTVGEACQKFDHIFRAARGLYLPISASGRLHELLANWPVEDVRAIVVTDGERILGLGDLGVGGMGIPIGKLALYTACAGVPPGVTLPITLDVGTNNSELRDDPLYLGLRQERVRGDAYHAFIAEFVEAVRSRWPLCCIQWEDFANINAVPILATYRDRICTYNDDIQCTAAVAVAGLLAGLHITKGKLVEQRVLFLGGGSAATGIAELIAQAMAQEGLAIDDARARNHLFDVNGLMTTSRTDLADFQKPFAIDHAPIADFAEAVKQLKPTAIVGVSLVGDAAGDARCPSCSTSRSSRRCRRSTSGRSSSRTRIPPRAPSARPRRPTGGRRGRRCSRAAARSGRSSTRGRPSSRVRATTSTSSRRWAWRCTRRRRSA